MFLGLLLPVVLCAAPSVSAAGATGPAWRLVAALPASRDDPSAATGTDGKIYVFGGHPQQPSEGIGAVLNTVEAYNPGTNTWSSRAAMPTRRAGFAAVTGRNGKIYILGGADLYGDFVNTVDVYSPSTDTWSSMAPVPGPSSGIFAVAGPNGQIYAVSGESRHVPGRLYVYDPRMNVWSTRASLHTVRSDVGVDVGPGGWIYAIGGQTPTGHPLNTVEAYNPATNTWTTRAPLPAARHWFATVTGRDGRFYVMGGAGYVPHYPDLLRTVVVYDPKSNIWTPAPPLAGPRTTFAAAVGRNGTIYAIGGDDGTRHLSTVEAYTP